MILITGCAGFIGYHTTKKLLDRGEKIIGIDNINDYYSTDLKNDRLKILYNNKNFIFYKHDISDKIKIDHKVDSIIHLAAQAGVRYSIDNPEVYEKSNNLGTLQVFEHARHNNINKIIYASSSSVYGNSTITPYKEDLKIDRPISLYASTKKNNELMAYTYHHLFGINMIGLRFFTVYGPWGRPDMAIFKFTDKILKQEKINVFNKGELYRDFTYIDDIVNGIVSAHDSNIKFDIINLARGKTIKVNDFIKTIEDKTNKKAIINYTPMQPGDVFKTEGDITKAKNLLNYKPKINIEEGVERFVGWYKDYYKVK